MERRRVALTVDVDLVNWVTGEAIDELTEAVPRLLRVLAGLPTVRATFFVRLDAGVARRFGNADFAFSTVADMWALARDMGHEVAWHHHAVRSLHVNDLRATRTDREQPERDEGALLRAIACYAELAREYACTSARMGWGQHTDASLALVADCGFVADATAMPRAIYPWDPPLRDWSRAPVASYHPSRHDHQYSASGADALSLCEIPMTMISLPLATDTIAHLQRYVNPAYHPSHFARAIEMVPMDQPLILVCHPYECVGETAHPLLAFSFDTLRSNLQLLCEQNVEWTTVSKLAHESSRHHTGDACAHAS